ncbi:MAG: TlpA disulfide reductase family protein [Acidobacteriota bacterium]
MKHVIVAVVLIGAILMSACGPKSSLERVGSNAEKRRYAIPSPSPFPAEFATKFNVHFLNGESVAFGELAGPGKMLVLNFWATWCGPCRREIPELTALDREFAGKDVKIVGLSVEDPSTAAEVVRLFGGQYSIQYVLGFASEEMFDAFSGAGKPVVPQTFVFDRTGKLVLHLRGFHPQFSEVVRETIKEGLG